MARKKADSLLRALARTVAREARAQAEAGRMRRALVELAWEDLKALLPAFNATADRRFGIERVHVQMNGAFLKVIISDVRDLQTREMLPRDRHPEHRPFTREQADALCRQLREFAGQSLSWVREGEKGHWFTVEDPYVILAGLTFGWDEEF